MSDTPRTDDCEGSASDHPDCMALTEHARQLERELADAVRALIKSDEDYERMNEMSKEYENIETVKRLDFDHLDILVSERIGALKLYAKSMTESDVYDAICRDLILPCVYTLAQFLESAKIEDKENT